MRYQLSEFVERARSGATLIRAVLCVNHASLVARYPPDSFTEEEKISLLSFQKFEDIGDSWCWELPYMVRISSPTIFWPIRFLSHVLPFHEVRLCRFIDIHIHHICLISSYGLFCIALSTRVVYQRLLAAATTMHVFTRPIGASQLWISKLLSS